MPRPQFFPCGAGHQTQIFAGAGRCSFALIPGLLGEKGIKVSSGRLLVEAFCICWPWLVLNCHPRVWEAEAGGLLAEGQPRLHVRPVSDQQDGVAYDSPFKSN